MANDDDDGVFGFRGAAAAVGAVFFRFVLVLLLLLLVTLLMLVLVTLLLRSRCNNSSLLAGMRASLEAAVLATACNADFRDRSTLVKADRTSKSCFGNGCCRLMKSSKFFCRLDFP